MKRFINLLAALALVVSMPGCGSGPATEPELPENPDTPTQSAMQLNIADPKFEEYLLQEKIWEYYEEEYSYWSRTDEPIDANNDGKISYAEAEKVEYIDASVLGISDMSELHYFPNLKYLNCFENELTSLDVSKNTALEELYCDYNKLTSLDVSKNTALKELICSRNQLTSLDVSKNTALKYLSGDGNQLTSLDVSKNTALKELHCHDNQLTSLDVSKNTVLEELDCERNQLTSLDVSKNTVLKELSGGGNQLTSLDVSKNTALEKLFCDFNELTSLDVSKNTALEWLGCVSNQLTSLDVSKNTVLEWLGCNPMNDENGNNLLTTIYMAEGQTIADLNKPDQTVIEYKQN